MDVVYKVLEQIEKSDFNELIIEYIINKELYIIEVSYSCGVFFFSDFKSNLYTDEINKEQVKFFLKILENTNIINLNLRKLIKN